MAQEADKHDISADALKAMAEGGNKPEAGTADGFVGPEPPEEQEEGDDGVVGAGGGPAAQAGADGAPSGFAAVAVPPAVRRQQTALFNQRERMAHSHQYKSMMVPLLLTVGVLLVLMSAYSIWAVLQGGPAADPNLTVAADGETHEVVSHSAHNWFPFLAMPLAAILMVGAWIFHRDVKRKKA